VGGVEVAERSLVDVLRAAKERISDPERWTQGTAACGSDRRPCEYEEAARFCALGSLDFECIPLYQDTYPLLYGAAQELFGQGVSAVNDRLGHTATLAVFDRAIELAEAEQT